MWWMSEGSEFRASEPKVSVVIGGIRSIRVSAEEPSCLEGVYTVRRSEKQAGDELDKKLYQIVDSL